MNTFKFILLPISLLLGCSLYVKTVNLKKNSSSAEQHSDLSDYANEYFWNNFHAGNYDKLDSILFFLNASYNQNPNHLETVTHLGFANIWALSERNRLTTIPPNIIDHSVLSLKYFGESYKLNPNDSRVLGFLSDLKLTVADISDDSKLQVQGYFDGKKAIRKWKEFNYFTIGYVLSQLPHDTWQFQKALEWQWKTLDECFCEKFDRTNPDITKYLHMKASEKDLKRKRACWNSWIAPHNIEGFFLNMGDMLVKNGDWKKAVQIYGLAKYAEEYESWDYKEVLEKRINSAQQNVEKFRIPVEPRKKYVLDDVELINSSISCMACHKMSSADFITYQDFNWSQYKKQYNVYWLDK